MWGDPNAPKQEEGDRFSAEDAENRVIIVRPMEYIDRMPVRDTHGDAVKLNIVDLNDGGRLYRGCLWFSGRLIKAFKHSLGTPFLGYVTKEKLPSGYRGWTFVSLAGNAEYEAAAQAWLAANPEFLTEPLPEKRESWGDTSHHEQGPAPEWAGAPSQVAAPPAPPVPAGPPAPPRPPAPVSGPPAAPRSAPPAPPAPPVPAAPAVNTENQLSVLERLKAQAQQPVSFGPGRQEQEPPF